MLQELHTDVAITFGCMLLDLFITEFASGFNWFYCHPEF